MILLVEDDVGIGRSISQGLSAKGFALRWLRQGAGVPDHLATGEFSVVILDVGLPEADGFELCRQIRAAGHNLPILMLTARGALDDRLEGFEAGADDYLPKPFAFAELVARVAVLARRAEQLLVAPVTFGPLTIDSARVRVLKDGEPLAIEPKPLGLLIQLAIAQGALVPRQALIDAVWGKNAVIGDNTLDVAISALRRGLAKIAPGLLVRVIKGQGYRLEGQDIVP